LYSKIYGEFGYLNKAIVRVVSQGDDQSMNHMIDRHDCYADRPRLVEGRAGLVAKNLTK
jgi:hypothetical protein